MKLNKELNKKILEYNKFLISNNVIILENGNEEKSISCGGNLNKAQELHNLIYENMNNIKQWEVNCIQIYRLKKLIKEYNNEIKYYTLSLNDWNNIHQYEFKKYGHNNFTVAESYNLYDEMKADSCKPIKLEIAQ